MSTDQPSQSGFGAFYKQFFEMLAQAYNATGDPAVYAFENYLRWKGMPADGLKPQTSGQHLSPYFTVLSYRGTAAFNTYHTLGASFKPMPGSEVSFGDGRGVRYEYILHSAPQTEREAADLLLLLAEYPFLQEVEYAPGFVLPVGEPVAAGSGMEYLYFTYPYVDDAKIYTETPWGQIERPQFLIQTLWVFPIHRSEAAYIQHHGADAWEEVCYQHHQQRYDAHDFFRKPYVREEG